MHRAIRYGSILGALLLGTGCQTESGAPEESNFIPRPTWITPEASIAQQNLNTTRVTGYAYDPEAFFLSFFECTQKCLPPIPGLPPFVIDNNPLFFRSVIRGAQVSMVNQDGSTASAAPAATDPAGVWLHPRLPSRVAPYYPRTTGEGALPAEPIFPVLNPFPANIAYLPTMSVRPVFTDLVPGCISVEAGQLSKQGILQAVAKFLTTKGTSTSADDFVNPDRFGGVTVFWLHQPGFSALRAPAANTTVEATSGQVLNVAWAPPGTPLPPPLLEIQSERGFFVTEGAPVSGMGISVVLHQPGATAPVTYSIKDPQTNAATARPWKADPITIAPLPGVITYAGIPLWHATGREFPADKYFCQPGE